MLYKDLFCEDLTQPYQQYQKFQISDVPDFFLPRLGLLSLPDISTVLEFLQINKFSKYIMCSVCLAVCKMEETKPFLLAWRLQASWDVLKDVVYRLTMKSSSKRISAHIVDYSSEAGLCITWIINGLTHWTVCPIRTGIVSLLFVMVFQAFGWHTVSTRLKCMISMFFVGRKGSTLSSIIGFNLIVAQSICIEYWMCIIINEVF